MSKKKSLYQILKDADERVKLAAVKAINDASSEVVTAIKSNMDKVGIVERTGKLRDSIKVEPATTKNYTAVILSDASKPAPKDAGKRNPKVKNAYTVVINGKVVKGTPYGQIIEFSPRIDKPFFYTAWYEKRKKVKEELISKIGDAWNGKS